MQLKGKVLLLLNSSVETTFLKSNLTSASSKVSWWVTAHCSSNLPSRHFQTTSQCNVLFTLVSLSPCHFYFEITPIQLRLISGNIWVSFNALQKHRFSLTPSARPTTSFRVTAPLVRAEIRSPQLLSSVWLSSTGLLSQTSHLAREDTVTQMGMSQHRTSALYQEAMFQTVCMSVWEINTSLLPVFSMMRHNHPTGTFPLSHIRTAMFTAVAISDFSARGVLPLQCPATSYPVFYTAALLKKSLELFYGYLSWAELLLM